METIFDLPAHPLFVHTPLVLMPLLTVVAIVVAVRPPWRASFGVWTILGSLGLLVTTMFAVQSGEAFDEALQRQGAILDISAHEELAETTRIFVLLFVLFSVVTAVLAFRSSRPRAASVGAAAASSVENAKNTVTMVGHACAVLAVVIGLLGSVWMFRTGHEGAKLVWDGTIQPEE